MAVSVTGGEIRQISGGMTSYPAYVPFNSEDTGIGRYDAFLRDMDNNKRKVILVKHARQLRKRADDARKVLEGAKLRYQDAMDLAKRDPSNPAAVYAVKDAASFYGFAASEAIAAEFSAQFAASAAQMGAVGPGTHIEANIRLSPTLDDIKSEIKQLEAKRQEIDRAAMNESKALASGDAFFKEVASSAALLAGEEKSRILFDVARQSFSTAQDGQNLQEAIAEQKALRRAARDEKREARIQELMDGGKSESAARRIYAKELRAYRQGAEWKSQLQTARKMSRLANGLVGGWVQEARAQMPQAIENHFNAKQEKKSAILRRDGARASGDIDGLENSLKDYAGASLKMTLAILRELTCEFQKDGFTKTQARKMAAEKFREEHERRKSDQGAEGREWRQRWENYRGDLDLLRGFQNLNQSQEDKNRVEQGGAGTKTQNAQRIRHGPGREGADTAHRHSPALIRLLRDPHTR